MTTENALELESVSKSFAGTYALREVSLTVRAGQIHGLVGQNGSGKSTLVKVLTGFHRPDSVERMRLWGREISFPLRAPLSPELSVVHQDLALQDELTVLENFAVTTRFGARPGEPVSWRRLGRQIRPALEEVGVKLDLDAKITLLTQAQRALLCIARSLYEARTAGHTANTIFVLDEATAHLDRRGASEVLATIRRLADAGNSAVLVSHRLREVVDACDEITVLRDGSVAGRLDSSNASPERILQVMLSRKLKQAYPARTARPSGDVALSVRNLTTSSLHDIGLDLHGGEVLGVTGLVDMGQDELPYAIVGDRPRRVRAQISLFDRPVRLRPTNLLRHRVGIVPADRRVSGAWMDASVSQNLSLTSLRSISGNLLLRPTRERRHARTAVERFGVRPPAVDRNLSTFSGGNQQKVVMAKWFAVDPEPLVMLLHEPTQGVDAGARWDLLELIGEAAARGMAILYFSNDHEELANVADRVIVLDYGRVTAELSGAQVTEENIVAACHAL